MSLQGRPGDAGRSSKAPACAEWQGGSWRALSQRRTCFSHLSSGSLCCVEEGLRKVHAVKAMAFPAGCGSWTVKEAEHRRTDACEPWCWRRLLRGPCTARRSTQSILKEINPDYSLEGLMLKLQYLATSPKNRLLRKDPDAGKD